MGDGEQFERPDGLDLRTVVARRSEDARCRRRHAEAIVARRRRSRAAAVVRELGADRVVDTNPDGDVDVRVPCANREAFRSWVLGLIEHAEVRSPPTCAPTSSSGSNARRPADGAARHRGAEERLRRLLVMLPWLMERGEVPLAEVAERFGLTEDEVARRPRAGRDVRAAAVRRRVDRHLHRRGHRVRRRAAPVHQAAAPQLAPRRSSCSPPAGRRWSCRAPIRRARSAAGWPSSPRRSAATQRVDPGSATGSTSTSSDRRPTDQVADAARRLERLRITYWTRVARRVDGAHDHAAPGVRRPRRLVRHRHDRRTETLRTFRLDRIESLEPTGELEPADRRAAARAGALVPRRRACRG